jgi:hypothetical protein
LPLAIGHQQASRPRGDGPYGEQGRLGPDWHVLHRRTSMAGATKRLAKAVAALAASGVVEKAVRKAAADPRVRRKAAELEGVVRKKARAAGKKAGKKATALARDAGARVGRSLASPRKAAGKKIKRLGKLVQG